MVDAKPQPPAPGAMPGTGTPPAGFAGERSKIKLFMERTPSIGALKSKFLTVLGNSNELLNGISNKLTLSSSSSDSDYCDDDEDIPKFDETIDYTKIDFEGRRVKARRAHEEIISGRYRQPNLAPRPRLEPSRGRHTASKLGGGHLRSSSGSSSSSTSDDDSSSMSLPEHMANRSHEVSSTTRSDSIESRHSGGYERARAIAGARRSEMDMQRDVQRTVEGVPEALPPHIDVQPPTEGGGGGGAGSGGRQQWAAGGSNSMRLPSRSRASNSSTLTSLRDEPDQLLASPSMESTDWRHFIRSESQNSVPSWASSISLDCRAGEEPVKEFMKHFTALLFGGSPASVDLELKSEFGVLLRLEIGRLWFTRFLTEQRHKSKRLDSVTFGGLAQYFALALFECSECEDYGPAAVLMNLCFLFYHEVEVPGCDPYREYLFSSLRQQPIWQQARFWNAIFHDALQAEREHKGQSQLRRQQRRQQKQLAQQNQQNQQGAEAPASKSQRKHGGGDSSSSSSHQAVQPQPPTPATPATTGPIAANRRQSKTSLTQPQSVREHEDFAFRQLGALTCNMHSLGTSQELCLDFLKKNVVALNLSKDKAKLIRDNIYRMYHETQLWGARHA
ncbi:uncharacterized protein KIAA0513 [Drosophila gunungcola]|uniref:SBF1/SBF2 domain-containing protein n=1 Tax=Drosophila gunungcola TaxID=103775 RepID=A0A9P9YJR8_9MUSC|nr:uncharacterized protein KIAA0513 [Drosophila gunungcola]XP_052837734.1 uncharacterized protein KIAA0513 [Drosophila gunungcola]XP_052837735.1 uncharacterized protein KIAA0513 [Drosophila gunungcola]KAI8038146.1 hypothetical protein M5D96_009187 [Drosophila gunungcola]